jgi:glycosidase
VPPNNWGSVFGGPAWSPDPAGEWYLHFFTPEQPDPNWRNPEVVEEFDRTLRFWFDRGVDGMRIDVAPGLLKDAELRDNPPWPTGGPWRPAPTSGVGSTGSTSQFDLEPRPPYRWPPPSAVATSPGSGFGADLVGEGFGCRPLTTPPSLSTITPTEPQSPTAARGS